MKSPFLMTLALLVHMIGISQAVQKKHATHQLSSLDSYIKFAVALPRLYEHKAFDSIQYYIDRRTKSRYPDEDVFCVRTLLAIERNRFSVSVLPDTGFYNLLDNYAFFIAAFKKHRHIDFYSSKHFNATSFDRDVFGVTSSWATTLLNTRPLDSMETFLCHVFAGDSLHPNASIWAGKLKYAALDSLLSKSAVIRRNSFATNVAFGMGIWIPRGHLSRLGDHPGFSFPVLGVRNKRNQVDWVTALRFFNTPNDYTVLRQGTLYQRDYYIGGYIGLDYTHYFLHTFHVESGIIAGIGYDAFDIDGHSSKDKTPDYLSPAEFPSFNYNLGVRFNYFFNPGLYIGLAAKYNFLNYSNRGGTPLDGNALSIDLFIGGN